MTFNAELVWSGPDELTVDDVEFHASGFGSIFRSSTDRFFLMKPRAMLELYVDLLRRHDPERVMELGVFMGGSTALLAMVQPVKQLTAIEKSVEPVAALTELLERKGLDDRVRVHYGVDQGDRLRLTEILDDDFGTEPLDLVVDDASHELDRTRASFELIFPRLRPGGLYVIEDWGWGHFLWARPRGGPSLARLVMEILLSLPYAEDLVADVSVNRYFATVKRGSAEVPEPFRLEECLSERGRDLLGDDDRPPAP